MLIHPTSLQEFESALANNKLVVVEFTAKWCGPCRTIAPYVYKMSKEYRGRIVFVAVDYDEFPDVAEKHHVSMMPTFQFYRRGVCFNEFKGANREALTAHLEQLLDGADPAAP